MAEDYQTSLRFSLKEAVWFKRGQEVADLLSIELNPQIGIEEKEEYIQVKGELELYGEYNKKEEEEIFSLRDFSQTATVEEIIEREDGVYVFTHNFPIDITIPKKRVKELEDIYILVDSFDYDLPESNTLQITADISITGLYEEEQKEEREEEDGEGFFEDTGEELNEESQNESSEEKESTSILPYQSMIESIFKEFSFEARKAPVEEVEIEQKLEEYGNHSEEYEEQEQEQEQEQEEYELQNQRGYVEQEQGTHEAQELGESEQHKQVESAEQGQEEYEQQEQKEYELQNQRGYEEHESEEQEEHELLEKREEHPHIEFFSQQAEEQQELAQEDEHVEEELKTEVTVPRSENELYLTKLFGGKEENFKKVRMYIVQNGDTLDSIAEKYELQAQQIARRNHLDEFYLTEGQILYLPVKKSK